jgi:hypothetical protein
MSQELINRSPDLKRLQDEGYEIEVKSGYALVHYVPYVNSNREVRFGTLVSNLTLAGDKTTIPDTHVIHFHGDHPCNINGTIITGIQHSSTNQQLADGIIANHSFSNKPSQGYNDYYEKFNRYIDIIAAPAQAMDPSVSAKTFKVIESTEESVFRFFDTNTSRANIAAISKKLENQRVAIVGLGGTGSYILDLVAKTPVTEIHLFDGDVFLQHNAFRTPGAPSIETLREKKHKVEYLYDIYQNMHKRITAHPEYLHEENIENVVLAADFVFISMDKGSIKRELINKLLENNKPFIDVGIGIDPVDDFLIGQVRVTTGTPQKNDHIYDRIAFTDGEKDAYSTNIQIADLNALNASLAVIKWKKYCGFYQDLNREHHVAYSVNTGDIINED